MKLELSAFAVCAFVKFPVAKPTVWTTLQDNLQVLAVDSEYVWRVLKTHLFTGYFGALAHLDCFHYHALLIDTF